VTRFNAYTVSDPEQRGDATVPLPVAASDVLTYPLDVIAAAAQASGRWLRCSERTRVAVLLARRQGCRDTTRIAAAFGISTSSVRRLSVHREGDERLVRPAAVCLGDERLRRWRL
jgi:hypothetical protein